MSPPSGLRFLRPYLFTDLPACRKSAYLRFYNSTRCLREPATSNGTNGSKNVGVAVHSIAAKKSAATADVEAKIELRGPVHNRIKELEEGNALAYPRILRDGAAISCSEYINRYSFLVAGEKRSQDFVMLRGRVNGHRTGGRALLFLDIVQDGHQAQVVCNLGGLDAFSGITQKKFTDFSHLVRRGDVVSIIGYPCRTKRGELSLTAMELPTILSPSLHVLPTTLEDKITRIRNRHVDLLVNRQIADTLRVRSHIIQYVRDFLLKDSFLEVQTPIIADKAGGAIARPFTTVATEFLEKELALRIAPEIWLKRLILGGMDRVFEIGPAFRNEGLDATHNPEFTTCEFYKSFASLEELISMTERIICGLAEHVSALRKSELIALPDVDTSLFQAPFKRIEFIPAIESALGESLPDLDGDDAAVKVKALFSKHNIALPTSPTLPRLLDKLASQYIEPQCDAPTFIIHHPACMAPLSKSFCDPSTNQHVSARVELFIHHREVANMYEEENSPFEQRAKFVEQAQWRDDENAAVVDESYIEALEWGLPPTGGWGCGIDRLCMLFSGANRISDVLAFGSLKNVVNLGRETVVVRPVDGKDIVDDV